MIKNIMEAFDVKLGSIITAVGGGGKTTLLKVLAQELIAENVPIIITTTTKIFPPENHEDLFLINQFSREYIKERLLERPVKNGFIYLGKEINDEGKIIGFESYQVDLLKGLFPFILVEGDGSLGKGLKAPRKDEPVIPAETDVLCPVIGLKVMGKPLTKEYVHRPELVSSITGLMKGDIITSETIAKVLCMSEGYYRTGYKYMPVLNQADNLDDIRNGYSVAEKIFSMSPVERVIITSFKNRSYMIKTVKR